MNVAAPSYLDNFAYMAMSWSRGAHTWLCAETAWFSLGLWIQCRTDVLLPGPAQIKKSVQLFFHNL